MDVVMENNNKMSHRSRRRRMNLDDLNNAPTKNRAQQQLVEMCANVNICNSHVAYAHSARKHMIQLTQFQNNNKYHEIRD